MCQRVSFSFHMKYVAALNVSEELRTGWIPLWSHQKTTKKHSHSHFNSFFQAGAGTTKPCVCVRAHVSTQVRAIFVNTPPVWARVCGTMPRTENRMSVLRYLTFATGLVECLCFAGAVFGWASLVFVLKSEGYFSSLCVNTTSANATWTIGELSRRRKEGVTSTVWSAHQNANGSSTCLCLQIAAGRTNSSRLCSPSPPLWTTSWRFPAVSSLTALVPQWLASMQCECSSHNLKHPSGVNGQWLSFISSPLNKDSAVDWKCNGLTTIYHWNNNKRLFIIVPGAAGARCSERFLTSRQYCLYDPRNNSGVFSLSWLNSASSRISSTHDLDWLWVS